MFQTVFSIEDLSRITGLTRRTIRYYIQQGLLAHPVGERRAAHYLASHLETLLRIRRLAAEGFSLEAIGKKLNEDDRNEHAASARTPIPGTARTCIHIAIAAGVELTVDPAAAKMSAEDLRKIMAQITELLSSKKDEEFID